MVSRWGCPDGYFWVFVMNKFKNQLTLEVHKLNSEPVDLLKDVTFEFDIPVNFEIDNLALITVIANELTKQQKMSGNK